jgi:hypothetical protein
LTFRDRPGPARSSRLARWRRLRPACSIRPGARSLGRTLEFDGAYTITQLRDDRGGRAELGGDRERQVERIGHRAVGPAEV